MDQSEWINNPTTKSKPRSPVSRSSNPLIDSQQGVTAILFHHIAPHVR